MVTVLQMAEDLTERAADQRVEFDLLWKYCLGLELEDVGFDASVVSELRTRMADHGLEERVLDLLLAALKEKGLAKAGGRQRSDSTHVLAAVRELNRLELAEETVRAALEALSAAAPHWVAHVLEVSEWNRRYGRRIDAPWRPPGSQAQRDELALDAVAVLRGGPTRTRRSGCENIATVPQQEIAAKGSGGHYQGVKLAIAPLRLGPPIDTPRERPPSPRQVAQWITTPSPRRVLHTGRRRGHRAWPRTALPECETVGA